MQRPLASIHSAAHTDSIPVSVRVVPLKEARDKRCGIPDRVEQAEGLPSPELIEAALRLWRELRETGVVSEKDCFYHIAWCILSLADHRVLNSPALAALEEQMEAAPAQEKDNWEWQLEEEADRIIAATLREYGEAEMAYLYETNRVEFHRRYQEGRRRPSAPVKAGSASDLECPRVRIAKRDATDNAARRVPSEPDAQTTQTTWTQRLVGGKKAYYEGDYAKAEEHFAAALKCAEVNGSLNHRAAAALNNLGIVYTRQKNFVHAEIALRRALRAYAVMKPEGTRVASVLCNLAAAYQARRRYAEAGHLYQQAIAITEKVLGSTHPKLAKRLESYARLLEKMNDPMRARKLRARVWAIRARAWLRFFWLLAMRPRHL